ncbi:MAG: LysR family transcriptional regulator [Rhizomicrobium sp.]
MPTKKERHVPKRERGEPAGKQVLDWEGTRIFLEIARQGSLRAAAHALGQSVNAIRRRLDRLEKSLGATLLTRHVDGIRLTSEGERVLAAALRMESATFELMRGNQRLSADSAGEIKLAATEGLGSLWIVPQLSDYRRLHANHTVNLFCTMRPVDVLRLEADVAVQLQRPQAKDLKMVKLGRIFTTPFASKDYIAAHGLPKTPGDIVHHSIVYQIADQVTPADEYLGEFHTALRDGNAALRTNSSTAHYLAILNGLGIGMLPTYAHAIGTPLVPIDIGYRTQHDIWLVYHPDVGRVARVHQMIEWLMEVFSPRNFPWFGDRFVHPDELPRQIGGQSLMKAFADFAKDVDVRRRESDTRN